MDKQNNLDYLLTLVSDNKREKIQEVIKNRTQYLTVALENISQPHNASAVDRSCDIFGIQDVHVVESKVTFQDHSGVAKGASNWLDVYRYDSITECARNLKKNGYTLVATTPHERGYSIADLPINNKIALLFGTEIKGLTNQAMELADEFVTIPMFGFTESFNISVSAAICLYQIISSLHISDINWQLTPQEAKRIQLQWVKRILHMDRNA